MKKEFEKWNDDLWTKQIEVKDKITLVLSFVFCALFWLSFGLCIVFMQIDKTISYIFVGVFRFFNNIFSVSICLHHWTLKQKKVWLFYRWNGLPVRILLSIFCFPFGLIAWLMPREIIKIFN